MYYNACPYCGANLDPGEKCECREKSAKKELPPSKSAALQKHTPEITPRTHLHYSRATAISQVF